jgi:hypothetical protein
MENSVAGCPPLTEIETQVAPAVPATPVPVIVPWLTVASPVADWLVEPLAAGLVSAPGSVVELPPVELAFGPVVVPDWSVAGAPAAGTL